MPRRLEGDRPQSNSWAFGGVVYCAGQVGGNFLIQSRIYLWGPSQRYIRPIHILSKQTAKEKNPPWASQQFLWSGTNRTCSIKHESFPRKRRQAATPVHKSKQRKDKRKGTEPRAKSPRRKSNPCPECGVLWAGAQCGLVVKDKVFLRKLYLNRCWYWEARKAQQ
jgi:hypothetical protein